MYATDPDAPNVPDAPRNVEELLAELHLNEYFGAFQQNW
jgi:hypothetical protein